MNKPILCEIPTGSKVDDKLMTYDVLLAIHEHVGKASVQWTWLTHGLNSSDYNLYRTNFPLNEIF